MLKTTFNNKRVFITGHTGFKGAWLVFMLKKLGADIFAISDSRPIDKKHVYYALQIDSLIANAKDDIVDIVDYDKLKKAIDSFAPDFVFHLAAQAIVSTSYQDPLMTFKTNILGTANILECLRCYKKNITAVIITSDKCYKNKERMTPYQEDEEMGGDDPYSASKGSCELVFNAYMKSYFKDDETKKIASTRAGNVFGGGDWSANRLIPDCIREVLYGAGTVEIRSPQAIRPWTFVVDILYGYILLAAKLRDEKSYQGSWNFASGETRTVHEVCQSMISNLNKGEIKVNSDMSIGKESGLLLIDEHKSRELLGWSPVFSLDQAFELTAHWYLEQLTGDGIKKISNEFIDSYFSKV